MQIATQPCMEEYGPTTVFERVWYTSGMAKTRLIDTDPGPDEYAFEELSEEEIAQAKVGTLFAIQGEEFANVSWAIHRYRTRQEMADDTSGEKMEWVADVTGELRGSDLVAQIGGGTFRFFGYVPKGDAKQGVKLAHNRLVRLAGPRKNFAAAPPAPPVMIPPTNGLSRGERRMLKMLRRQDERLRMLENQSHHIITSPAGPTIKELAETMVMLQALTQKGQPASDTSVAKQLFDTMMAATKTGIELGQGREPAPAEEVNTTVKVIESVAPLASRFLDILASRSRIIATPPRAAPGPVSGPSPPPPSNEPSSAEEIGQEREEVPPITTARMMVVIDTLAMGATNQDAVEEIADLVDEILPDGELEGILRLPDNVVVSDIAHRSGAQYPILATDAGRNYVAAILRELRRSLEHEDQP